MSLAVSMTLLGTVAGGGGSSNIHSGAGAIAFGLGLSGVGTSTASGVGVGAISLGLAVNGTGAASATTGAGSISLNTAVVGVGAIAAASGVGSVSLGLGLAGVGSGGAGSTLTTMTLLTTDATNIAANSHFELGIPLAPGALGGTNTLQVLDAGSNVINVQEDNRSIDVNGDCRFVKLTGLLPSAPGATNTTITLKTTAGNPVTTNPITVANLLAQTIGGETFEWKVSCTFPNGDVYTALATDALQGSGTWTYGSPQNRGTFRSGPLCTEWICSAPLVHSGTPHAFLNAQFHITAYKALPGAWNASTNPITSVKVIRILENGYADQAGGADLVYDLLDQVGSSLTTYLQLNGSTPAATLTLGAVSGLTTAIRNVGTWAAANTTTPNSQDCGKAIVEIGGSGIGYMTGLNSSTNTAISIPSTTPFSSTTKTSTTWRVMGVYHPYMERVDNYGSGHGYSTVGWWGTTQKVVAALPTTYIINSRMVMNYGSNAAVAGAPDLTGCNQDGSHPMGVHYPTGTIKNFGMHEGNTGDVDHIGVLSYSYVLALLNLTYSGGQHLNARVLIFQNSRVGSLKPFWLRDSAHGGLVTIDQAGIYYINGPPYNNSGLQADVYVGGAQFYEFAGNHSGDTSYLPYVISGDIIHLEGAATSANNYSIGSTDYGVMTGTNWSVTLNNGSASILIGTGYPQEDGEAICMMVAGYYPQISGVNITVFVYYVRRIDGTHINLYDTHAHAVAGGATGKITFSSAGSGISIRNGYGKSAMPNGVGQAQPREQAWNDRAINHLLMIMPSTITPGLIDYSRTRANMQRQYNAIGTYMKTTFADDANFQAGGPRFLGLHGDTGAGGVFGPWQNDYYRLAMINAYEGGAMGADHIAFFNWFCADGLQWYVNSDVSPYFMVGAYYVRAQSNSSTIQYTYAGVYQEAMRAAIGHIAYGKWAQPSQSATISSVSNQAAVTVVFSQTFFDTVHPTRHVGSWIIVGSGCGQITSITNGTTCVADATVATWDNTVSGAANFSTGSGQTVSLMPLPSAANAASLVGTSCNYGQVNNEGTYTWLANSRKEITYQLGIDTGSYAGAVAYMTSIGLPVNPAAIGGSIKANVVHR